MKNNSFQNALKGFFIYGSTQIILSLISLVKTKFVAVYVGLEGVGIHSILNSNVNLFTSLSGLGISIASITYFVNSRNYKLLFKSLLTVVTLTCLLCIFFIIIFSESLSTLLFNNTSFSDDILIVSSMIFFSNYTNLKKALIQSLGQRRILSKSSIISSIIGLLTLFVYAKMGADGIAFALTLSLFITFLVFFYTKPILFGLNFKSLKNSFLENKLIIRLGIALVFSGFYFQMLSNVLNVLIVKNGSISEVGEFQASLGLTNQAIGLIFAALALDYLPRLSNVINNKIKLIREVRNQIHLVLIFIGPLLLLMIIFIEPIIKLLLTEEFLKISKLSILLICSMLFKSVQWCFGYIFIAEGKSKKYFIVETLGITIFFLIVYLTYSRIGILGIGYGYIYAYLFYLVYYILIFLNLSKKIFNKEILIHLILIIICVSLVLFSNTKMILYAHSIYLKMIALIFTVVLSFIKLKRKINIS